jgi:hypothetical protein
MQVSVLDTDCTVMDGKMKLIEEFIEYGVN